jgi:hypothetical protein
MACGQIGKGRKVADFFIGLQAGFSYEQHKEIPVIFCFSYTDAKQG